MTDRIESIEKQIAEVKEIMQHMKKEIADIREYIGFGIHREPNRCEDCEMYESECTCDKCFACGRISCTGDCSMYR
jgi:hypothetical protein